jgi:butyrate kinase
MGIGLKTSTIFAGAVLAFGLASPSFAATRQMEKLSRGLAVANTGKGMLVSWRLLGTENPDTEFNLYRDGTKIATIGKTAGTNYLDADGKTTSKYTVAAVVNGKVDAILLTGGIAYSKPWMQMITDRVSWIAPVKVYKGENEMLALAICGKEILDGVQPKEYK